MHYKTKSVLTKNEDVEAIDKAISDMYTDGYELLTISSVHFYIDSDYNNYFTHFLVFVKKY